MATYYSLAITLVVLYLGSFVRSQCNGLHNPIAPALNGPINSPYVVTFEGLPLAPYGTWNSGTDGPFQVSPQVGQSVILTGDSQSGTGNFAFLLRDTTDYSFMQWNNNNFWAGSTTETPGYFLLTWRYHWSQLQFDPPVSAVVMRANTAADSLYLGVIKILDANFNIIECRNIPSLPGINTYTTLGFSSAIPIRYIRFENVRNDILVDKIQYLTCNAGYMYIDGACADFDECTLFNNICGNHSTCQNTIGSHLCICYDGYEKKNGFCVDTNECLNGACGDHSTCTNTEGSYSCACDNGYELNNKTITCNDIDECTTLDSACGEHSTCKNLNGSYACPCNNGFELNNETMTCKDINECLSDICGDHSICTNTIGSHSCRCDNGYKYNETMTCIDIDECATLSPCSSLANCTNTDGSFMCLCGEGYEGSGLGQNGCQVIQPPTNGNTPSSSNGPSGTQPSNSDPNAPAAAGTGPSSSIVSLANITTSFYYILAAILVMSFIAL